MHPPLLEGLYRPPYILICSLTDNVNNSSYFQNLSKLASPLMMMAMAP